MSALARCCATRQFASTAVECRLTARCVCVPCVCCCHVRLSNRTGDRTMRILGRHQASSSHHKRRQPRRLHSKRPSSRSRRPCQTWLPHWPQHFKRQWLVRWLGCGWHACKGAAHFCALVVRCMCKVWRSRLTHSCRSAPCFCRARHGAATAAASAAATPPAASGRVRRTRAAAAAALGAGARQLVAASSRGSSRPAAGSV